MLRVDFFLSFRLLQNPQLFKSLTRLVSFIEFTLALTDFPVLIKDL